MLLVLVLLRSSVLVVRYGFFGWGGSGLKEGVGDSDCERVVVDFVVVVSLLLFLLVLFLLCL